MNTTGKIALTLCTVLWISADHSLAASNVTTMHGPNPNFDHTLFDSELSNSDLIHGLIATELPGDTGWHPANPASGNSLHPNGLPAFTDGVGGFNTLTGLLNDFPGDGNPAKVIQYDLAQPANIGAVNILAGNSNDVDGRMFVNVVIRYSDDNGENFYPLGGYVPGLGTNPNGYYSSDVPLAINRPGGSQEDPQQLETLVTFMSIFDDESPVMALGVTNLQFDFYASNNSDGWQRDGFDGLNPFTEFDDSQPEAISSPLIWEIDVLEGPDVSADFNSDEKVDGQDFLIWQRGVLVNDGSATLVDGDADGDTNVDGGDLTVWEKQYGSNNMSGGIQVIPEPIACNLILLGLLLIGSSRPQKH